MSHLRRVPMRSPALHTAVCAGLLLLLEIPSRAQSTAAKPPHNTPQAPAVLPGKGLAQHDFFYAGEQKEQRMLIVREGRIVWSYYDRNSRGEISDAVLKSNGNILFAHQYGVTEITRTKRSFGITMRPRVPKPTPRGRSASTASYSFRMAIPRSCASSTL